MKDNVWGTDRMIEHHKNGAFDVLIAWSTHLKSICLSCGIRSMPLEKRIFFHWKTSVHRSNKPQRDDCPDHRGLCPVRWLDFERTRRIYVWLCLDRIYWSQARQRKLDEGRRRLFERLHRPSNDLRHAFPSIGLVHRPSPLYPNRNEQDIDGWWIFLASF